MKLRRILFYCFSPISFGVILLLAIIESIGHAILWLTNMGNECFHIYEGWALGYKQAGWTRIGGGMWVMKWKNDDNSLDS